MKDVIERKKRGLSCNKGNKLGKKEKEEKEGGSKEKEMKIKDVYRRG